MTKVVPKDEKRELSLRMYAVWKLEQSIVLNHELDEQLQSITDIDPHNPAARERYCLAKQCFEYQSMLSNINN